MEKEKKQALDRNIRQCLSYTIKNNGPFRWSSVLGFTAEELKAHLKERFEEGMSFSNYGEWVISFYIPKRCYNFASIRDPDFRNFYSLKNIVPRWLKDAQHQKKQISKKVLDKYKLWDLLPIGNIDKFLVN